MREHGLLAHQRVGRAHGPKAHDGTITTERIDLMWGADLTSVMTGEGQAAVFVAVDHGSAECVGLHVYKFILDLTDGRNWPLAIRPMR
jgi:hypothetical protein